VLRQGTDWEELAQHQPYFRVLASDGVSQVESNDVATAEFWETGTADIAVLLPAVASIIGQDLPLTSVLDFGCGAGRLTLPLARRAATVVACDIAPTMLDYVRQNAETAGLPNITALENDQLITLPDGRFTFICSLLVFQYIPKASGYDMFRTLLRLLAPDGVAVLQVVLAPPGARLRQLARMSNERSHRTPSPGARASSPTDGVQTYEYDESVLHRAAEAANARILGRLATQGGSGNATALVLQKAIS
jgi:SAM-dependent methyltransferase